MDSSSWTLEPISQDNLLVTIALALAAILAVLTIIGMVVGARNKRKRLAAEREEQARIEALREDGVEATNGGGGDDTAPPAPVPETAAPPPSQPVRAASPEPEPQPVPVAPSPPPLSDQPVPGTPAEPAPLADEPIAAAAPLDASPASIASSDEQASMPVAASVPEAETDGPEPVTRLKGLGPKIAAKLAEHGITTIDELAALTDDQAAALDAQMGPFQGRIERDRWREQARLLADGDRAGFEREFGKLG